jgi:hypothetical protein
MDEIGRFYTLNHAPYMVGALAGQAGEEPFEDSRLSMIVGGAATQLNAYDKPQYFRPTTDIDMILNKYSRQSDRKKWAKAVAARISHLGYEATGSLTNHGAEARFNKTTPDLIVHLDCTTQDYFRKHEKRIAAEFERAHTREFGGIKIRYTSPQDIISNKLSRINKVVGYGSAELTPEQVSFIRIVSAGAFDDLDIPDFEQEIKRLLNQRSTNIETLARDGFEETKRLISAYKIDKDLYDIALTVAHSRESRVPIPKVEFLEHCKNFKNC